ncbi:hypothetical protein IP90_00595 [Luteimonas cucumeris]|uniref:Secreted protein n=1 Tax=Luteimonas cucumeris TaxID=985012 RepID=A0A562LFC6_9GAMM|nr:hypothetical protein [Luteimonas cucumeris]TWI06329.1 hypothetical protein IP90_00595 [Luteimonas cucumeris]
MQSLLKLPFALLLALAASAAAHAQSRPANDAETAILPIWNNASGKVEAALYLEPTGDTSTGARWHFGKYTLDTKVGLGAGESLALLCDRKTGISSAIGSLTENCFIGALDNQYSTPSKRANAGIILNRGGTRLGLTGGTARDTLPGWLVASGMNNTQLEQNDLTLFAEKSIGRNGVVSIGGTTAKARLVPAADLPAGLTDRWNTKSLSVGGGVGAFSANIIGRVVDVPGRAENWEGLGLGVTWRTPWSGQLTVGAENVVTRGKNPFSPSNTSNDDGTVPYVRYEQDL